ncbi:hypothetical protein Sjap_023786 [Stephania japonica]|uniref:FAD/NAD(P)-binding oxidoreductase family protein n=1 Tax=Stephania japonica TaxID=461633 RepID=A0AAP0EKV5_9MAGN
MIRSFTVKRLHLLYGASPYLGDRRRITISSAHRSNQTSEELLVVVGGGAAGVYGAIRAKSVSPNLRVLVVEKGKPLSKACLLMFYLIDYIMVAVIANGVKISGGGRCNVTNGHCLEHKVLAEHYPRGKREFQGPFFLMHGPADTMSWFMDHGVNLKTEDDGRVFPVSNSSSSIIDCLMQEADRIGARGVAGCNFPDGDDVLNLIRSCANQFRNFLLCAVLVSLQTGKVVTGACTANDGKFHVKIEKRTIGFLENVEADYLLIASGSSQQGYNLATQLGHSIVNPVPSLFTFKIADKSLVELSGVLIPSLFAFSTPGMLLVDFILDIHIEVAKAILLQHKIKFVKQKVMNSFPPEFGLVKRFWKYLLDLEGIDGETFWASISNNSLTSLCSLLKNCLFNVTGKGQFKDEFVTAGGVPLSEISLQTMESKITPRLFFAGEVLNVDGETGGFNFQNAWSGGYIAGTSIGKQATEVLQKANVAY